MIEGVLFLEDEGGLAVRAEERRRWQVFGNHYLYLIKDGSLPKYYVEP